MLLCTVSGVISENCCWLLNIPDPYTGGHVFEYNTEDSFP